MIACFFKSQVVYRRTDKRQKATDGVKEGHGVSSAARAQWRELRKGCEIQARYDGKIDGSTGKSRVSMCALVDGERGVLVERIVESDQTFCPHGLHRSTGVRVGIFTGYPGQRVGKRHRRDGKCIWHKLSESRKQAEYQRRCGFQGA
ncbi:hypothetical protein M3J09_007277 [Ascochyta lentis]